jgi:hypothetical protein
MPVDFEPVPCRTGFVNLAPKYSYQIILVNFCLVLIIPLILYFSFKTGTAAGIRYVQNLVI